MRADFEIRLDVFNMRVIFERLQLFCATAIQQARDNAASAYAFYRTDAIPRQLSHTSLVNGLVFEADDSTNGMSRYGAAGAMYKQTFYSSQ